MRKVGRGGEGGTRWRALYLYYHRAETVSLACRENRNRLTQIMLLKSLLQVSPH